MAEGAKTDNEEELKEDTEQIGPALVNCHIHLGNGCSTKQFVKMLICILHFSHMPKSSSVTPMQS